MNDFPWLTVLIVVPLVGAVVTRCPAHEAAARRCPSRSRSASRCSRSRVAVVIAAQYDAGGGIQFTEDPRVDRRLRRPLRLGVDGLGLLLVLLTVVLVPVVLVASWHDADDGQHQGVLRLGAGARGARRWRSSPPPTCSSSTSSSRPR